MRRRCRLLLCNLAEPARCPPGWDLLVLAQCRQARSKFGGCLTALSPLWIFFSLCIFTFLGFTLLIVCCGCWKLFSGAILEILWMTYGIKRWGFVAGKGASGAASWAPVPCCRLDVCKTQGSCVHRLAHTHSSARVHEPKASQQLGFIRADCPQRCSKDLG